MFASKIEVGRNGEDVEGRGLSDFYSVDSMFVNLQSHRMRPETLKGLGEVSGDSALPVWSNIAMAGAGLKLPIFTTK